MQVKIIGANTQNGLEKKLNQAISDLEAQGHEIVSVTPWSITYRALILYK